MDDGETREEVPMHVMIHKPAEREAQLMQAHREELVERIARAMREDGTVQPLQGLHLSFTSRFFGNGGGVAQKRSSDVETDFCCYDSTNHRSYLAGEKSCLTLTHYPSGSKPC